MSIYNAFQYSKILNKILNIFHRMDMGIRQILCDILIVNRIEQVIDVYFIQMLQ